MSETGLAAAIINAAQTIEQSIRNLQTVLVENQIRLQGTLLQNQSWFEEYLRRQRDFAQELSAPCVVVDSETNEVRSLGAVKPKPVAYCIKEGGAWYNWQPAMVGSPYAIKFEDGSIFDMLNGWRP